MKTTTTIALSSLLLMAGCVPQQQYNQEVQKDQTP
jgi:hypothetical protein